MTPERVHTDYLEDILEAIGKVAQFIQGMIYEQFAQDAKTVFAVIHTLEIIGEATKKVLSSVRESYTEVPWRAMAGMRVTS